MTESNPADSILTTVKGMVGLSEENIDFDFEIIPHINSVLMSLNQMGIGPSTGFVISDKTKKWSDYLGTTTNLEAVKSYIGMKVRLIFDPPSSSFVLESIKNQIAEFEWRLTIQAEGGG